MSVAIVRAFAEGLSRLGVPAERLCRGAAIDPGRLSDPTDMLSIAEYGRVLEEALRLSGDPAFALKVGERAPTGALHTVGYLLLNCPTMREAIAQFVHHAALIYEDARWHLVEQDDRAAFVYDHPALEGRVAAIDAEFCLAFVVGVGRHFSGPDASPRAVCFRHAAPGHTAEIERVFRCPVLFDRPRNEIVFKRAILDEPQLLRDEPVAQLLRQRADALLAERQSDARLKRRIIDLVKYRPELATVDAETVARRLGVGPRTLRRRLASLEVSLSELVEQARCDLAREALAGLTPIKEIAARLGFSEPSAFYRAFKRWTGTTPGRYRKTGGIPGRKHVE